MTLRNIACFALDTKAVICETPILIKLKYYKHSTIIFVN